MRVRHTDFSQIDLRARIPFRYGIATLRSVRHLVLGSTIEIDGAIHHGFAAENLPPKWFTKDPSTSYEQDLSAMREVIRQACRFAEEAGPHATPFALWRTIYDAQAAWARDKHPPLLASFGVSMIERAVIDAFCRATGQTFFQAVRTNSLGIDLGSIHRELAGARAADLLPGQPLQRIFVRHTVGLSDPLTDDDVAPDERIDDGLPQTLTDAIGVYGLRYLKIKLAGDVRADLERLRRIAAVVRHQSPAGAPCCAFTLDGNENYLDPESFRHLWEALQTDPALDDFMARRLFVEQPLRRDLALSDEVGRYLRAWNLRPAMIIDESDDTLDALPRALACGYTGTSHKNCKGVFKGLATGCLIAQRRQKNPKHLIIHSAEDLTTVGPVALLQDLAVIATLGISHAERNGHHYFAGLSGFPPSIQDQLLTHHPDLYQPHSSQRFPTLTIQSGSVSTTSINAAPFGAGFIPALAELAPAPGFN